MTEHQADILILLVGFYGSGALVAGWVLVVFCHRILDALHTLIVQGSARRLWEPKQ